MQEIVVVGLGNPGKKYEKTRHNIGFEVVKKLAEKLQGSWHHEERCRALVARIKTTNASWHLLCPQTFMNLSGQAVASYLSFYRIPKESLVAVIDDVNIPFDTLRMREKGSTGGHKGLEDIERVVGREYRRLRIGVGSPKESARPQMALEEYVLSCFTNEEQQKLPELIERAAEALLLLPLEDVEDINKIITKKPLIKPINELGVEEKRS